MAHTSKLVLYNDALRELGSHPLANLTTPNTRLQELEGAFPHAVEYVLSRLEWNFARRRATLVSVADGAYPPFPRRYTRPSDYLRKVWIRRTADDDVSIEHAEVGAALYGYETSPLIEYMSDSADNYEPVNWPPQFTRALTIYLALLTAPKLARDMDAAGLYQKFDLALEGARQQEVLFVQSVSIPQERLPVFRRALEMLGQQAGGSLQLGSQADTLRNQMNRNWSHAVRYILEQESWSFATKRALLSVGRDADEVMPGGEVASIVEGYSVDGDGVPTAVPNRSGYRYGFDLPEDFLHKVWVKRHSDDYAETDFQIMGRTLFAHDDVCVLEYVAIDDDITHPAQWSAVFTELVATYLAVMVSPELVIESDGKSGRISAPQIRDRLMGLYQRNLSDARLKDGVQQRTVQMPPGRFVRARLGGVSYQTRRLR